MSQPAKYKIGIFGSSAGDIAKTIPLAKELGRLLGERAACPLG